MIWGHIHRRLLSTVRIMIVPPLPRRRAIDRDLVRFFREQRPAAFRRAISGFCRFYNVRQPRLEWYEYLDWGKAAGKTYEDGRVHLVHPENWKRGRVHKSERMWVQTVYHELGHYLFWAHPERKADAFSRRMVLGLRPARTGPRSAARRRSSGKRAAARTTRQRAAALRRARAAA